jgi:hypothetical protein
MVRTEEGGGEGDSRRPVLEVTWEMAAPVSLASAKFLAAPPTVIRLKNESS